MFRQAYNVTKEMYISRGWTIIEEKPYTSITALITSDISENESPKKAAAKFIETTQDIKTTPLASIIDFTATDYGCITIVCSGSITTSVKKIEQTTYGKVEIFHTNDLQMNITTYHLQPLFEKLSASDCKDFKKKYVSKNKANFQIMSKNDPVARFYRYQSGDIVKITTKDDDDLSYRIVK
jgi:DNA-directed RNA polymerase subunit H (RpoH/RPB5)